jgi:hypothetical protein
MKKWIVIIAVLGIISACFCLWATLAPVSPGKRIATDVTVPTRTVRPTYTVGLSATAVEDKATEPVEPTNTPRPTDTPRPTPTQVSEDGDVYLTSATGCLELMSGGMGDISTLLSAPRLTDEDWIMDVATAVTMVNVGYEGLEELGVPAEMQDTHDLILWATKDCYDAMPYLVSGLDNLDAADLDAATLLMTSCTEKMSAATDLLP